MLADPSTVTINSVANILARTSTEGSKSVYQSADGLVKMTVSHQKGKGQNIRSMIRLDQTSIVENPLDSSQNIMATKSLYLVVDRNPFLATVDEQVLDYGGLNAFLAESTNANLKKLLGQQT